MKFWDVESEQVREVKCDKSQADKARWEFKRICGVFVFI